MENKKENAQDGERDINEPDVVEVYISKLGEAAREKAYAWMGTAAHVSYDRDEHDFVVTVDYGSVRESEEIAGLWDEEGYDSVEARIEAVYPEVEDDEE